MPEKLRKNIPKVLQNDAEINDKICDLSQSVRKGENAPNCLFSNRKRASANLKTHEKRISNRFKIDRRKRLQKSEQN